MELAFAEAFIQSGDVRRTPYLSIVQDEAEAVWPGAEDSCYYRCVEGALGFRPELLSRNGCLTGPKTQRTLQESIG